MQHRGRGAESSSRENIAPPAATVGPFTISSPLDYGFATPRLAPAQMLLIVGSLPDTGVLYADELEIRLGEGLVLASGRALTLSVREFELLVAMAQRIGAVITREELYDTVWGGELRPGDRSVDVYVSKLRGKLEAAMPDHRFIHTHPGVRLPLPTAARTRAHRRTRPGARKSAAKARRPQPTPSRFHEIFTSGRPALKRLHVPPAGSAGALA